MQCKMLPYYSKSNQPNPPCNTASYNPSSSSIEVIRNIPSTVAFKSSFYYTLTPTILLRPVPFRSDPTFRVSPAAFHKTAFHFSNCSCILSNLSTSPSHWQVSHYQDSAI